MSPSEMPSQPSTARAQQQPLSIDTSSHKPSSGPTVAEITSPLSEEENPHQARPESAQRTFSDPLPSPSPSTFSSGLTSPTSPLPGSHRSGSLPHQPKSAPFKNLRFALKGKDEDGKASDSAVSPTMRSPTARTEMGKPKRRHSHEPRVNVYTECGRHGDDWLFGGFSVSGTMKKIWEKKE